MAREISDPAARANLLRLAQACDEMATFARQLRISDMTRADGTE